MRTLASLPLSRACLNAYYNSLSIEERSRYHDRYSRLFREGQAMANGAWTVHFLGKPIRLPLRSAHSWTDWASALAILGHDPEVKTAYQRLLRSDHPPEVFLDVGANFGTHSLLFASQGVRTISFEPNARCHAYIVAACEMNGFDIQLEAVAIGARDGEAELVFPEDETWLGSIAEEVIGTLRDRPGAASCQKVRLRRLDSYADMFRGKRVLLKIDVEGSETSVIEGASRLLSQSTPNIIFESNDGARRSVLYALLADHGYVIHDLRQPEAGFDVESFVASPASNFLATINPASA
ncbi:MAG: FkbM family methyltransferase [Reyranella sp.]|nr:FkbM family methyltransferase [Reyranella sp.]